MTGTEMIKGRRSIRSFQETPIDHALIEEIIATASFAPSWKNTQVARYTLVEGAAKAKLAECTTIWAGNGNIINSAPAVIAVSVVTGRCGFERDGSYSTSRKDTWQMYDAGVASQTLCLAAYEKGLGTVILGLFDYEDAAKVIELPEGQEIVALIPIGYPAVSPEAPKRKEVADLLRYIG